MTCIVGLEKGNTVWLGGDSAATDNTLSQMVIADKKVFPRGEFIFGVCGLPKVMDVLNHQFDIPEQKDEDNDRKYVAATFLPALKECFKKNGCMHQPGQLEQLLGGDSETFEGAILFGYRGKLYRLESNFQIITSSYKFDAVGSGQDIALGSLHSTAGKLINNPEKRILKALEASAINNAGVRPPFHIISVKKGKSAE